MQHLKFRAATVLLTVGLVLTAAVAAFFYKDIARYIDGVIARITSKPPIITAAAEQESAVSMEEMQFSVEAGSVGAVTMDGVFARVRVKSSVEDPDGDPVRHILIQESPGEPKAVIVQDESMVASGAEKVIDICFPTNESTLNVTDPEPIKFRAVAIDAKGAESEPFFFTVPAYLSSKGKCTADSLAREEEDAADFMARIDNKPPVISAESDEKLRFSAEQMSFSFTDEESFGTLAGVFAQVWVKSFAEDPEGDPVRHILIQESSGEPQAVIAQDESAVASGVEKITKLCFPTGERTLSVTDPESIKFRAVAIDAQGSASEPFFFNVPAYLSSKGKCTADSLSREGEGATLQLSTKESENE